MEPYFFMIVNGQQAGPFERSKLKENGLTPDTYVWREGMADWAPASTVAELNDLFIVEEPPFNQQPHHPHQNNGNYGYGQPNYGQPNYGYPDYNQPNYGNPNYGQPNYGQPNYGYPNYGPNGYNRSEIPHYNWLPWAIVATVLGCFCCCIGLVFGIIAIVKANNANRYYAMGDRRMGDYYNSGAKTWTIITLVLAGLSLIANIFYFAFVGSVATNPYNWMY